MEQAHSIVVALSNAVEAKDSDLKDHCRHMTYRAARLGAFVGLRGAELESVAHGALLHDIGKIAIPVQLLHKVEPLTDEEWGRLRRHPGDRRQHLRAAAASRATSRPSSATTTSAGTARAIPMGCGARRSRSAPASWRSPTPTTSSCAVGRTRPRAATRRRSSSCSAVPAPSSTRPWCRCSSRRPSGWSRVCRRRAELPPAALLDRDLPIVPRVGVLG